MQGLRRLGLLTLSLSGPFNLASGSFLINNCSALWNSEVMETGVLTLRNGVQKDLCAQEPHRALLDILLPGTKHYCLNIMQTAENTKRLEKER